MFDTYENKEVTEAKGTSMESEMLDENFEAELDEKCDAIEKSPNKVLKRDEYDLLRTGNDLVNQRLEIKADDYRDKGMSEKEISERLAADRWDFQKEYLDDAFPDQDVSPHVFNGFSENGAKDRMNEIKDSEFLRNRFD